MRTVKSDPRTVLIAILVVAAATIGGALVSEHVFGLVPCKLCLLERRPYYVVLPLGAAGLLVSRSHENRQRALLLLVGLVFAVSAILGAYHAGAEWGFWPGPADCGGGAAATTNAGDLLASLNRVRVVSCTDAAWRFAGLSLAGWNALISAGLACLAVLAGLRRRIPSERPA